ncbi:outer membrane protein assembly factor BamC [Nitrococcus mobilis]|uniref:NlpBDapX lipoprotein n=1 Tax=Nitrococcus mobilis Nb-231 TaxID=314278 RepID=A4BPN2_9GAMM|nr:outer membrane protein assembly factor BamC [Nitrococcus mobilis]EAR22533.1 NlpBDapX lipoprotein [Nitrococcus mobilis Nb-231]
MSWLLPVVLAIVSLLALTTGCMSAKDSVSDEALSGSLTLPPDLKPVQNSTAMAIPAEPAGSTGNDQRRDNGEPVLPKPDYVTLHWNGHERWLDVAAPPSQVWRWLGHFVKRHALDLTRSDPRLGFMETAWFYSAPPLTRGLLAPSVVDRTAASVADRYLIRVEEGDQPDTAEVFVTQRRLVRDEQGKWRLDDADRFLEAEFMRALLLELGGGATAASAPSLVQANPDAAQPKVQQLADGTSALVLHDQFFEAWRRIGLALDRAGFTVVDRDRSARHYFVRYDTRAEQGPKDKGLLDTVAFWREEIPDTVEKYRIDLTEVNDGTQVTIHRFDGAPATEGVTGKILGLVEEQLH